MALDAPECVISASEKPAGPKCRKSEILKRANHLRPTAVGAFILPSVGRL
jgi:hypothetical protein